MPTRGELVAHGRSLEQVASMICADALAYQDLEAMKQAVRSINPVLENFEASCFDGKYITGDVDDRYLDNIERQRLSPAGQRDGDAAQDDTQTSQLHLQLSVD